jgi:hypothetical protein
MFGSGNLITSYIIMNALPASILTTLTTVQVQTLTHRRNPKTSADEVSERTWWLSVGALLIGCCILAAFVTLFSAMRVGDYTAYRAFVQELAQTVIRLHLQLKENEPLVLPEGIDAKDVISMIVALVPVVLGMIMAFYLAFNVWASARLLAMSTLLPRPWVSLHTLRLPYEMAPLFLIAGVLALFSGFSAFFAQALVGTFLVAYAIQGGVTLHLLSINSSARPLILIVFYITLLVMPWVVLFVALFGFIQTFIPPKGRKPPPPPSLPTEIS